MINEAASGKGEYDKPCGQTQRPLDGSGKFEFDHRVRLRC
jgi:hypothetical protein